MRDRALCGLLVAAFVALSACANNNTASTTTATTRASTTTRATTTSGPPPSTVNPYKVTDDLSIGLDKSILTTAELSQAPAVAAPALTGTVDMQLPPQGPIDESGTIVVLTSPVFRDSLNMGKFAGAANETYVITDTPGAMGLGLNILAIKFESGDTGTQFLNLARNLAVQVLGGTITMHPEAHIGIIQNDILRIPPPPTSVLKAEIVVVVSLYTDGVYYLIAKVAPVGMVTDATMLNLIKAQDAKYQNQKASLEAAKGATTTTAAGAGGSTTSST
jgi:hypothetical protein